eukprot:11157329-Karenia_brevis.AAC.1
MSLEWASVWGAEVSIFHRCRVSQSDDLKRRKEDAEGRTGGRKEGGTGCIQNENPHIGEWWE